MPRAAVKTTAAFKTRTAFKKGVEWFRHKRRTSIFNISNLVIAATAASATIVQAWVSASQTSPLPQLQATSIGELRLQIQDRRTTLQREIQQLDALLKDLGRAEIALTSAPVQTPVPPSRPSDLSTTDPWWRSALKTFGVYFVLAASLAVSLPAVVVDLVALIFGYDFPILRTVWGWSWSEVTIAWYWERATATGVAVGILLLFAGGLISTTVEERSERSRNVPAATV